MNKPKYVKPNVEIILFSNGDVITTSGYFDDSNKPGWGWGDNNHDYYGPPGHNNK